MPYFTICIPAYNREYTLKRCLDSLCQQTMKDFEVVFVDDGSTDNTEELVASYTGRINLRYFKKQNGGKHTALNVGIKNASDSELFLILDSDDWLMPDALEKYRTTWDALGAVQKDKLCGIACRCKDQNGKLIGTKFKNSPSIMSYLDMHFGGVDYGDCCECTRTNIVKCYKFPEPANSKFVPEYYIYDQIGTKYSLYCLNDVTRGSEYMEDGITRNIKDFFEKNCVGFSYGIVCRIENVFTSRKCIPAKAKVIVWYEYWKALYFDKNNLCKKVKKVDFYGFIGAIVFYIKRVLVMMRIKERV